MPQATVRAAAPSCRANLGPISTNAAAREPARRACVPRDAAAPDRRPIARCPVACLCFAGSVRKANTRACMSESAGIQVVMRRLTLRLEDRCAEELSCTQFIQDIVGFTQ